MRMTDSPLDCAMALSKQELARQVVECDERNARLVAALEEAERDLFEGDYRHDVAQKIHEALAPEH